MKATIMIPAYNAEEFIGDSLESAINQTYKGNYEILVVNDGSKDDTQGKIEWYKKKFDNLRLINQENVGQGVTRNTLFDESKGQILLGLDADDLFYPNALERVVNYFDKHKEVGFVYTNQDEIDEQGHKIGERKREECHSFFPDLVYHCQFVGHLRAFRRETAKKNRFNPELRTSQDWDITLKMVSNSKIAHIPEILYAYRINEKGIGFNKKDKVISSSVSLLKEYVKQRKLYGGKQFEVIPVNAGKNIYYYDHLINGKSMMDSDARRVLERYLKA